MNGVHMSMIFFACVCGEVKRLIIEPWTWKVAEARHTDRPRQKLEQSRSRLIAQP
jgi:hypothetical protein